MKRKISIIMILTMLVFVLAACGGKQNVPNANTTTAPSATAPSGTAPTAAEGVKTGLAVISSIAKSTDAGEKDGLAEVDSTIVAVMVDSTGKIANCKIDAVQTKINFSKEGKITTPLDTAFKTKQELGTAYGMGKASKIKKEWNEQANAFAAYVTGKTVDEVKGIAVNAEGVPTAAELTSSVTVHIADFVAAIEKAVANAKDLGAKSGDKLGFGAVTVINKSTDAAADKEGLAQAYSTYTAATFGADGKITSSIIDASQSNVNFSKDGKITSDKAAVLKTKNELGPEYGMAKASKIKKEWNEQADAFAKYVVGKTAAEVKGIAVNAEGVPTAAELTSSVTIHVDDFMTIIEKASANAK
ncbi:MAG: hypothetical protein ABFD25_02485 [Clostridiaceae bacterium]